MRCRVWLLPIIAVMFGAAARPCVAEHGHQRLVGGIHSMFTTWDITHEQEDGTGNDVCIMEARGPAMPGIFAIRKDMTRSYYKQRVFDPGVVFVYAQVQPVNTVFDGDLMHKSWHGDASGTGPVFDVHIPGGDAFDQYMGQLIAASAVSVVVGEHVWTASIGGTSEAFAVLQDCISSVTAQDGRW